MDANEYQVKALRTALPQHRDMRYIALGLADEAGELAGHIKHGFYHNHPMSEADLLEELGDLLWYVAVGAEVLGQDLASLMATNLAKLSERYPDGFTTEDSIAGKGGHRERSGS